MTMRYQATSTEYALGSSGSNNNVFRYRSVDKEASSSFASHRIYLHVVTTALIRNYVIHLFDWLMQMRM